VISLDSFSASPYDEFSERDQNIVGQGNNVAVRINESCLASFLFHIHDGHKQWRFRVDSSMQMEDFAQEIFHIVVQDSVFRLFSFQIIYESTRRARRLLK